ncbi:MAG TPA: hypothetical protein VNO14_14670 [Blastocatellia bacterium]|nr:hypothetical protein [Blastocatellia bacterium]
MKKRAIIMMIAMAQLAASLFGSSSAQDKSLKPEDLIARHLEAVGPAQARSAAKSRTVSGTVTLRLRVGGAGNLSGDAMMVSSGPRLRFGMRFPTIDYPREDMAYDGARAATGFLPKGGRSQLSAFLSQQDAPLKEGLLGGVLSTAWPLLRVEQQQPRLEYRGLKKIEGRELHEIGYRPRKGSSSLRILLHFDPETLRHVRTYYRFQIGASIGTRENANLNPESDYSLTEEFDDFREVDRLMLPHKYRLQVSVQSGTASALYDYSFEVSSISHTQTFDERIFSLK